MINLRAMGSDIYFNLFNKNFAGAIFGIFFFFNLTPWHEI